MTTTRFFLFLSFFTVIWSGCSSSDDNGTGPTPTGISGPISKSATWSGTVKLAGNADILAGVHITIAAGTVFEGADSVILQVHGNLSVNGTADNRISMIGAAGAVNWGGIVVESGGVAQLHHVSGTKVVTLLTCKTGALACVIDDVTFGGLGQALDASSEVVIQKSDFFNVSTNAVEIHPGGNVTITDSRFAVPAAGDLVIVNGGALTMSYSQIQGAHGDVFILSATHLNISYCDIIGANYGIMIGGTSNASVQHNNFQDNNIDVGDLGSNVAVDMSNNYWGNGTPVLGAEFSFTNPSATSIQGTGPRP